MPAPENFIASELYEEIVMKNVPIAEWPNWWRLDGGGGDCERVALDMEEGERMVKTEMHEKRFILFAADA